MLLEADTACLNGLIERVKALRDDQKKTVTEKLRQDDESTAALQDAALSCMLFGHFAAACVQRVPWT